MKVYSPKFTALIGCLAAMTVNASAATDAATVSAVPEPSVALLGGLCGIVFLLWRKK